MSQRSVFPSLRQALQSARALTLCLAFVGCASTGPRVAHAARIADNQAPPTLNMFKDAGTSATIWASAFMFGLPGMLISSSIAGGANRREMNRWSGTGAVKNEKIAPIMTEHLRQALERSGKLTFPKTGTSDLSIRFREINFGMRNKGKKRYAIVMEANVVFSKPGDEEFYDFGEELESTTAATVEEYGQRPEAFVQGITEIAEKFATLVAEDYEMPAAPRPRR